MVVDRLRQWLILFRAHTGMLEAPIAAIGAAMGLGYFWSIEVALWALFGLMYHWSGYGMNSYVDWKKGFDRDDPFKSSHPLNTGEISPNSAKWAIFALFGLTLTYAGYLAQGDVLATSLVVLAVVCGLLYNYFGKITNYKFVPISIAHSLVFLIPYTLYNGYIDGTGVVIFTALFIHHTFQISISGDIKDISQDEASLLKKFGMKHLSYTPSQHIITSLKSKLYCDTVSILQIIVVFVGYVYVHGSIPTIDIVLMAILSTSLLIISIGVYQQGVYVRSDRLSIISRREIVGYWLIYVLSIPIIGLQNYIIAFILSIIYLIIHSKFMWGTYMRPEV